MVLISFSFTMAQLGIERRTLRIDCFFLWCFGRCLGIDVVDLSIADVSAA
jgi:hypothetical protein